MKLELSDAVLEYDLQGTGEPILFIHGALLADGFAPLVAQPALAACQRIRYYRRGYRSSTPGPGMIPMARHAADARGVLERAALAQAHVVGHSFGALIALQLALQAPQMVRSLTLLEAPMRSLAEVGDAQAALGQARSLYNSGDRPGAVDVFLRWVAGEDYRSTLEQALGALVIEHAVADCPAFFDLDAFALNAWDFQAMHARQIACPVLSIMGDSTQVFFQASHEQLVRWLPGSVQTVIYRAGHLLQMERPQAVAEVLARFLTRQPAPAASV